MSQVTLSRRERQQYRYLNAIGAGAAGVTGGMRNFETEVSDELRRKTGIQQRSATSILVPTSFGPIEQRDLTVGVASAGGNLVQIENVGFIDILRPRLVTAALGAMLVPGLVGNAAFPKLTSSASTSWLANEAAAATESQQTLGQSTLVPKTVSSYVEISRLLTLQSTPAAEMIVRNDLARVNATAVDSAAINGTGASGQPTGLLNTAGIGTFSGTTLGATGLLEAQSDLAAVSALDGALGYATTAAVAGLLAARVRFASTASPLWEGPLNDGRILGHRAISSSQVPAATMIFGDWSQMMIGEWGVLEIDVNPFAQFSAGIIGVRCMYTVDVGIRQPAAFTVATSIT